VQCFRTLPLFEFFVFSSIKKASLTSEHLLSLSLSPTPSLCSLPRKEGNVEDRCSVYAMASNSILYTNSPTEKEGGGGRGSEGISDGKGSQMASRRQVKYTNMQKAIQQKKFIVHRRRE